MSSEHPAQEREHAPPSTGNDDGDRSRGLPIPAGNRGTDRRRCEQVARGLRRRKRSRQRRDPRVVDAAPDLRICARCPDAGHRARRVPGRPAHALRADGSRRQWLRGLGLGCRVPGRGAANSSRRSWRQGREEAATPRRSIATESRCHDSKRLVSAAAIDTPMSLQ